MIRIVRHILILLLFLVLVSCSKNTLVRRFNGCVKALDGTVLTQEELTTKYYLVYYGASWCPYCVEMKDEIKDFYNTYKDDKKLLFIFAGCGKDKSNEDLTEYLKSEDYPFYYIDFDHREESKLFSIDAYTSCEKFYIPGFILFNQSGKVLSNSNGPKKDDYKANRPLEYYREKIEKE